MSNGFKNQQIAITGSGEGGEVMPVERIKLFQRFFIAGLSGGLVGSFGIYLVTVEKMSWMPASISVALIQGVSAIVVAWIQNRNRGAI